MPSTREIRRRIRSVKSISKVTNAMETVSASKMRRAQQQVAATRPYADRSWEVMTYLARVHGEETEQPLLARRPERKIAVVLISADRGLAGAYNSNIIRKTAEAVMRWRAEGKEVQLITLGRKGRDWMLRHGPPILADFTGEVGDRPTSREIAPVARVVIEDFSSGVFDSVYLSYTRFVNTLRLVPEIRQLLPIVPAQPDVPMAADYIFEPDAQTVLHEVLYGITELQILQAVYEALASEQSARMVAMRNATDAATDLISSLTLTYNKIRQEAITRELIDIVGGSASMERA
jgi:F-type H+-transporting ATPase subunit gamma